MFYAKHRFSGPGGTKWRVIDRDETGYTFNMKFEHPKNADLAYFHNNIVQSNSYIFLFDNTGSFSFMVVDVNYSRSGKSGRAILRLLE